MASTQNQKDRVEESKRPVGQLPSMLMAIEKGVLAGHCDARDALDHLLKGIISTDGVDGAAVAVPKNGQLVCTAAVGNAPAAGSVLDCTSGPYSDCLSEGRMVHLQRGAKDLLQCGGSEIALCRSAILLPLRLSQRHGGILAVFSSTLERLTNNHIVVLGTAATIASLLAAPLQELGSKTNAPLPPSNRASLELVFADCLGKEQRRSANLMRWFLCIVAVLALAGALFGDRALLMARGRRAHNSVAAAGTLPYTIEEQIGQPMAMDLGQSNRGGAVLAGGHLGTRVPPAYPATALREGREGKVMGTIVVNPAGVVEEVKILSGDPVLAAAVQTAVGHWRYAPFRLNERSVTVAIPLRVTFRIVRP